MAILSPRFAALYLCLGSMCGAVLLSACTTVDSAPPLSAQTVQEVTRTLSSDAFGGREPGTPSEQQTVDYIAQAFASAGLQPGNGGSWFQSVPLVEITGTDHQPISITGGAQPLSLAFATDWVGATYREAPRIDLSNSEMVFVGYGINAPEKGWNDYAGVDVRGKTVLILVNDPDYMAEGLEGPFNGRAMTYYGRWTYKFEEAARQGAAAALIVHDTFPAAYGWNVVESSWTGPQSRARSADAGSSQTLLNGWVQLAAARAIASAAGQDLDALMQAARQPGFAAVPLGLVASTSFANTVRHYESRNVMGVLPGTSRPAEHVLYTAHWDHLGRCTPNAAGDDICNGAIDNATGVAALVALAEAQARAGATPRSQLFVAVTAEEQGLLGSEYYAANPVVPLSQTVGGVNMDAMYVMGEARDVVRIGGAKSDLDAVLAAALAQTGQALSPDPNPEAGRYYRSDHFSLAKRGVPMLYLKPGHDLVAGGTAAGDAWAAAYNARAYHGPDDEYDENWDWVGVMRDLGLYYTIGRMLGESEAWPNWNRDDEFRRIRDETCAPAGGC
jgi:Zn-dependent M28 family amino/carboxypeptidase